MFGAFRRPVGSAADVRELEYISALHQTSSVIHTDATVSAQDVLYFLRSRYGLEISSDDAIDIVKGLSGTARLPLPQVEKMAWGLKKQKKNLDSPTKKHKGPQKLRKRCKCFKSADDEDQEDELAALEAQLESLKESKTDTRRGWEFPALQRQIHREVPKNVTSLVRYDLVQMMSILLIPSILRIERHRFKQELAAPPPREPLFAGMANAYDLLWNSSKLAHKIIKAPVTLIQKARQRRLSKIKESLRPKPDTLLLDVLRILLGSLEERNSPLSKVTDFAASTTTGTTTTATGRGRHFPELLETRVTKELIQRILLKSQQEQAAQDDELIEQMMELVGGEGAILDERAFAHALTADVTRWPLECEDDVTTTFFDVYGFGYVECNDYAKELTPQDLLAAPSRDTAWSPLAANKSSSDDDDDSSADSESSKSFHSTEMELRDIEKAIKKEYDKIYDSNVTSGRTSDKTVQAGTKPEVADPTDSSNTSSSAQEANGSVRTAGGRPLRMGKIPKFKPTAGYIDYSCDSYSSLHLVVSLFGFFLAVSALVVAFVNYTDIGQVNCEESFGCQLANTIVSWAVFALVLSLAGLFVIMPISLVNQSYLRSIPQGVFAIGLLLCYIVAPIMEKFLVEYVGISVSQAYLDWRASQTNVLLAYIFYVFGGLTFLAAIRLFAAALVPKGLVRRFAILRTLLLPNDILRSTNTKRSGTYKLNEVIDRSYRLHAKGHKRTKERNADHETMLSFLLYGDKAAKSGGLIWSWMNFRYLNTREGVWFHARLAFGQVGQVLVTVIFVLLWYNGTKYAMESSEAKRDEIEEAGGVGAEWGLYFVPEAWMIYYSFGPGGIVCICVLVLLFLIQYPSTASLILKYRSGFLPSLHDPQFQKYRKGSAYIYYNTGNMIYAAIGAATLFFVLVAGLLFLIYWPPTAYFMSLVIAWAIGLSITVGAKMIMTMICGTNYWKSFYRRRPAASNVSSLAYECWHLGLGGGVLVSRLCQFLLAAAFWIGRIDSQFLSNDVEAFGYHFDTVPQKYVTELLVHDAHRHPFMERLAAMYLMRLKHGEYFSTDAGTQWRIVFVLTLMPWMVKFSNARDDKDDDKSDENEDDVDWQLNDSANIAENGAESVRVSGNVPWNPSTSESVIKDSKEDDDFSSVPSDVDSDGAGRPGQRPFWKRKESAESFVSARAVNGEGNGMSRRMSSAQLSQFASARDFDDGGG